MQDPLDIDKLRAEFKAALAEYMREGAAMCNLLTDADRDPEQILMKQQTLNTARERYEAARSRYVCAVLGDFTVPLGQRGGAGATPAHRFPDRQ
jgi:hypothetical protein